MSSMNLKFGDVTVRGSPTCSDCHYVKKIIFSLNYCFLSMFSIFVVLFNIVWHFLMSCHNFSLFIIVPCILFYGDLLTLKTHHYRANSMNSLNSMKELWKNSIICTLIICCRYRHSVSHSNRTYTVTLFWKGIMILKS